MCDLPQLVLNTYFYINDDYNNRKKARSGHVQGGPKVGIQLLKVGFGSKSRFVVLM